MKIARWMISACFLFMIGCIFQVNSTEAALNDPYDTCFDHRADGQQNIITFCNIATLSPGETIEIARTVNKSSLMVLGGQFHYSYYQADGTATALTIDSSNASLGDYFTSGLPYKMIFQANEQIIIKNTGINSISIYTEYYYYASLLNGIIKYTQDVDSENCWESQVSWYGRSIWFTFCSFTDLSPGERVEITATSSADVMVRDGEAIYTHYSNNNEYGGTYSIDGTGSLKNYFNNGNFDSKIGFLPGSRVLVENTGISHIRLVTIGQHVNDVSHRVYTEPAYIKHKLRPGKNLACGSSNYTISVISGQYDYTYNQSDNAYFSEGQAPFSFSCNYDYQMTIISNTSTSQNVEVVGPPGLFIPLETEETATTLIQLNAGETVEINGNMNFDAMMSLTSTGKYDYAEYQEGGYIGFQSYEHTLKMNPWWQYWKDKHWFSNGISKAVVTNGEDHSINIKLATRTVDSYEARQKPALSTYTIEPGKTLQSVNIWDQYKQFFVTDAEVSPLSLSYRADGGIAWFEDTPRRTLIQNTSDSPIVITSASDFFARISESDEPIYHSFMLKPEESLTYSNAFDRITVPVSLDRYGETRLSYADYDGFGNEIHSYNNQSSCQGEEGVYCSSNIEELMPHSTRVITNSGTEEFAIYGPAELFQTYLNHCEKISGEFYGKIDTACGSYNDHYSLLKLQGSIEFSFGISYSSQNEKEGVLGQGWSPDFDTRIVDQREIQAANQKLLFKDYGYNNTSPTPVLTSRDQAAHGVELVTNQDGTQTLKMPNQDVFKFDGNGRMTERSSAAGDKLLYTYDEAGRTKSITEGRSGKFFSMEYLASGRMSKVSDSAGRNVSFTYDSSNRLIQFRNANGFATNLIYATNGRLSQITNDANERIFEITYSEANDVIGGTDGRGNNFSIEYNRSLPDGLETIITKRDGSKLLYRYNSAYLLTKFTDELGDALEYTFDENGNMLSVRDPLGNNTAYTYDERGNLLTSTNALEQVTKHSYDEKNNLLSTENNERKKFEYKYDDQNNLIQSTDPMGHITKYAYDSLTGDLLSVVDPEAGNTRFQYDDTGLLVGVTDAEGRDTQYSYDKAGRVITVTSPVTQMKVKYDKQNNVTEMEDALYHKTEFTYDKQDRVLTKRDPKGNQVAYEYDSNGNVVSVTGPTRQTHKYEYDKEDRIVKETDPLDYSTTYVYDEKGRITASIDPLGHKTSYMYDALNRIVEVQDALDRVIAQYTYDAVGNQLTVKDALNNITTREYDTLNRLTMVVDPLSRITTYDYDELNRLVAVTDPLEGKAYQSFDSLGRVSWVVDANLNQKNYEYNRIGQLKSKYLKGDKRTEYYYEANGLLKTIINRNGQSTELFYDGLGRVSRAQDEVGTLEYVYDENSSLIKVSEELAGKQTEISQEVNELNQMVRYKDSYGNQIVYQYDQRGYLVGLTYPNNKQVTYSYDGAGRLASVVDWSNRTTFYSYDANGRLIETVRPDRSKQIRGYDASGRLVKLEDVGRATSHILDQTFDYDAVGNLLSESGLSSGSSSIPMTGMDLSYEQGNRLEEWDGTAAQFDSEGNMTYGPLGEEMQSFKYDARNRLIEAGNHKYEYDANNHRISQTVDGVTTRYVIDPSGLGNVLMETDESGNPIAYYIYGIGLIGAERKEGDYFVYHSNQRGDTIALTDLLGNVTDTYSYGPMGEQLGGSGDTPNPFLYGGSYGAMTDSNGLYYLRARYYNPDIKRFMNEDTYEGKLADIQSLNMYAFVGNNPLIYTDPSGHIKDSDNFDLRYIVRGPTEDWEYAYKHGDTIGMKEAEEWADMLRTAYYTYKGWPIPSDVKNRTVPEGFQEFFNLNEKMNEFPPVGAASGAGGRAGGFNNSPKGIYNPGNARYRTAGCNCFIAGTKVLTNEGEKNIEDIEVGDKVLAKDELNPDGELAYKEVTGLYRNQRDDIIKLYVGEQIIETTDNHPFWVEGEEWVFADELQVGDKLQKADGSNLLIDKVEFVKLNEPVTVYNFTVADYHTYYVTELGIWVHNTECTVSANNLASLGKNNKGSSGLTDAYITKSKALDTAKEYAGKNYSTVVDKNGYTRYISENGKYVARYGYKQGNNQYELNLEIWENGKVISNYHMVVK